MASRRRLDLSTIAIVRKQSLRRQKKTSIQKFDGVYLFFVIELSVTFPGRPWIVLLTNDTLFSQYLASWRATGARTVEVQRT